MLDYVGAIIIMTQKYEILRDVHDFISSIKKSILILKKMNNFHGISVRRDNKTKWIWAMENFFG